MAPSPGDNHKNYFNDSTFSDLTLRLSDRTVHVHRVTLCSCSAYFRGLIDGGFREGKHNEIELQDDNPDAMMALLRCIYETSCGEPSKLEAPSTTMEFLAEVCVVAEKYQVEGVQAKVAEQIEKTLWSQTESSIDMSTISGRQPTPETNDFLVATKIVFDGTTKANNACRTALVTFCVLCIRDLKKLTGFSKLLSECAELGAAIIAHDTLSIALEGSWGCESSRFRHAVPRCSACRETFPMSYIRNHRDVAEWTCCHPACDEIARPPVCLEWWDDINGWPAEVSWCWED